MPNKNTQFNNLFNNDDKPSDFVIDLKQQAEKGEVEKISKVCLRERTSRQVRRTRDKVKDFYYNLIKFIRRNLLSASVQRGERETVARQVEDTKCPIGHLVSNAAFSKLEKAYEKHGKKINQLAFFFLFRYFALFILLAVKWFYKLCYGVGWLVIFIVRFVWLAGLAVVKPIICLIHKISFSSVKIGIIKLLNFAAAPPLASGGGLRRSKKTPAKAGQKLNDNFRTVWQKLKIVNVVAVLCPLWLSEASERLRRGKKVKKIVEPSSALSAASALRAKMLSFAIILFIIILPFKALTFYKSLNLGDLRGKVLGVTETAINDLVKAGDSVAELQFSQASQNFSSAGSNFLQAQNELDKISDLLFVLASIAPDQKLRMAADAKHILSAGQAAAAMGNELSLAMDSLFGGNNDLIKILNSFSEHGNKAVIQAKNLKTQLNKINSDTLPAEYREQFILIQEKGEVLENGLSEFVDLISKIQAFLGINQDKRYLLVFQNNTELRASGGFIGSYALVDFSDGKIKNIEAPAGGSYDTEAGLYEHIISPEPLHLVNPLWHFWDANWWPDWEKSAKKLMWFYEKSDGPTVDGVIAFTPTVIERILAAIGPIDMSQDYGVIIDAENFWLTTQKLAEQKFTLTPSPSPTPIAIGEGEGGLNIQFPLSHRNGREAGGEGPKKIIGDLMNKIIEELPNRLNKDTLIGLIKALEESLSQKHILFYFTDDELQNKVADLGWDGKIKQTNWDYLMVVNTNIAGGKSDKKIKEVINHSAEVLADGTIINTVVIKRTHTGIKREPFCGVRNVNWMRIYAPIGSELIEARGFDRPDEIYFAEPEECWQTDSDLYFETTAQIHWPSRTKIYNESWKTVFANWTMVDPGETITIYLKYKLPFKLEKTNESRNLIEQIENYLNPEQKLLYPYALLAQKQSGSIASEINSVLKLPNNFNIVWQYPDGLAVTVDGWDISDSLEEDKYWAVILEMQN
ncbi:DUF4012 domain-containing protein [Candidatus Parcubacteria bacterium]|nr:DUF4012 domain-containing protein [Candidatus Parcubacteria bacterium]